MDYGDPIGGSLELARLIDEYGEFIVPDLKRYYGMDLRDLFLEEPAWTPRFVLAHINSLDFDSATMAEVRGGVQFRGWDETRYLLASISNAIRLQSYILLLANRDPKKRKPNPPTPWELPKSNKAPKKKQEHKPGSFAAIALGKLAAVKKRKEGVDGGGRPRR